MLSYLRQLQHPKEFRIEVPSTAGELWDYTDQIIQHFISTQHSEKELIQLLQEMGKGVWRIQNRLTNIRHGSREVDSALRFLHTLVDAMEQFGVKIQDHTGERITGGEALHIISYETVKNISQEQVIETIKPTITYKGQIIQIGEVIVGQPEKKHVEKFSSERLLTT